MIHEFRFSWFASIILLLIVLTACNPSAATASQATGTFLATATSTQPIPPSPTRTQSPTNTAILPTLSGQITPAQEEPTASPTQIIYRPPAPQYTCPWVEQAHVPVYTYQVINTYEHDPTAYTQGLIIRDGELYESTGLYGRSSLRRVALESGEVEQVVELAHPYFGEGITELDGVIYQLTWTNQLGFVYDAETFERLSTFSYPTQGWGLTHDGKYLIMSDGSPNLYLLDPQTLKKVTSWAVLDNGSPVFKLNELEYLEGEVWANVYQTSCIARIDPANGQVLGWIDISGILTKEDLQGTLAPDGIVYHPEVPNGIAYDAANKSIFVTGKFWPKLFEIKVVNR